MYANMLNPKMEMTNGKKQKSIFRIKVWLLVDDVLSIESVWPFTKLNNIIDRLSRK